MMHFISAAKIGSIPESSKYFGTFLLFLDLLYLVGSEKSYTFAPWINNRYWLNG